MNFILGLLLFTVSTLFVCMIGLVANWGIRAYQDLAERRAIARRERELQNYFAPVVRVPRC